ncbi:MAG: hypothetical protein WBV82_18385, partial [Myxococcaceae bacterium]
RELPAALGAAVDGALAKSPASRPRLPQLRAALESSMLQAGEVVGLPELSALVVAELPGAGRLRWCRSAGDPVTGQRTQTVGTRGSRSRISRPT